jgi:hypothetical protein
MNRAISYDFPGDFHRVISAIFRLYEQDSLMLVAHQFPLISLTDDPGIGISL